MVQDGVQYCLMHPRLSQWLPGREIPEKHWMYKIAKQFWFNDFSAYRQLPANRPFAVRLHLADLQHNNLRIRRPPPHNQTLNATYIYLVTMEKLPGAFSNMLKKVAKSSVLPSILV